MNFKKILALQRELKDEKGFFWGVNWLVYPISVYMYRFVPMSSNVINVEWNYILFSSIIALYKNLHCFGPKVLNQSFEMLNFKRIFRHLWVYTIVFQKNNIYHRIMPWLPLLSFFNPFLKVFYLSWDSHVPVFIKCLILIKTWWFQLINSPVRQEQL